MKSKIFEKCSFFTTKIPQLQKEKKLKEKCCIIHHCNLICISSKHGMHGSL